MHLFNTSEWISAFKDGDQIAMRQFFDNEKTVLIGWLFNHHARLYKEDKEDLMAEAFASVFNNRRAYKSYKHAATSLMTILKNNTFSYYRKKNMNSRYAEYYLINAEENYDPDTEDIDHLALIRDGIGKLSPGRRKILELMFFDGKETREIAEIMGINRQTVLNQRTDAINFLRSILPYCSKTRGRKIFPSWHLTHNQ
jgi:RNA polymerase sigma factor (sigma-70 family)